MNSIPNGWREFRLGDVCHKIGSGATPRGGNEVYLNRGVALIRSQNVYNNQFERHGLAFLRNEHADELENVTVEKDDILLNITGDSVARVCQVPDEIIPARVNQHVAIIRSNKNELDSTYLRYLLSGRSMQSYMFGLAASGGTRNALTKGMIESFKILAPASILEQRAIAKILSDLDEKIELNRQMNKTLESIAQALFRRWFVDFEPWGGKQPDDWRIYTLDDVAILSAGGDRPEIFSEKPSIACTIPIYSNGIDNDGLYGYTNSAKIFDESVTVSARGTIGFTCLRQVPYFSIVRLISLAPNLQYLSAKYLYLWLKSINISGTGTTQQQLTIPDFKKTKILIPAHKIMKQFTILADSMFAQITANKSENATIAAVRDSLLPRLMSGKMSVNLLCTDGGKDVGNH